LTGLAFVCDNLTDIIPTNEKHREVDSYIYKHQSSSGVWIGRPGGIELILFKLQLKTVQLAIKLTPDNQQVRNAVVANIRELERANSNPNATILLSTIRTAIGRAQGVVNYGCDLAADITSEHNELITFGDVIWL